MHYATAYRFSHRIKQLIGLALCVCIAASTLVSAAASASTMRMAVNMSAKMPSDLSTSLIETEHSGMSAELPSHDMADSKTADHRPPNTHTHHAQSAPCDHCDQPGQAGCPDSCIVNLCCTAAGLSGFFNSLQLIAPKLTERYLNHDSSRCITPQPSLVLRPPIA